MALSRRCNCHSDLLTIDDELMERKGMYLIFYYYKTTSHYRIEAIFNLRKSIKRFPAFHNSAKISCCICYKKALPYKYPYQQATIIGYLADRLISLCIISRYVNGVFRNLSSKFERLNVTFYTFRCARQLLCWMLNIGSEVFRT